MDGYKRNREELLSWLPQKAILTFYKGSIVRNASDPSSIYLVVSGTVMRLRHSEIGKEVLVNICRTGDIFGEAGFHAGAPHADSVVAFERTELLRWKMTEIEEMVERNPRIAITLLEESARHQRELVHRIEVLATDGILRRLVRSLLFLGEHFGEHGENDSIRLIPLPHSTLGQYIGASRAMISEHMGQLRDRGYLAYSRQGIILWKKRLEQLLHDPHSRLERRGPQSQLRLPVAG
jgi:CRP-like cAMP-binding protein